MTDRTKVILAAIAGATVLAVVVVVLLIPKRHVIEIEGAGPLFQEPTGEEMERLATTLRTQLREAEREREKWLAKGDAEAAAEYDEPIAAVRKRLREFEESKNRQ